MKKQQKRKKTIHNILSSTISKFSKGKVKKNSLGFWIRPGQIAHAGIIFAPLRKSLRKGKETSPYLKKDLRNYTLG